MKLTTKISIALMLAQPICTTAQTWSLEDCVAYALEHNLTIEGQRLNIMDGELQVTEAKDRFLPSVSASAGESVSFGRGLTANNTYADRNTSNFQWGMSLQLPLFQGMSEYRQLKLSKSALQQALYEHEAAKDDITLNVISLYLQVHYAHSVCESA